MFANIFSFGQSKNKSKEKDPKKFHPNEIKGKKLEQKNFTKHLDSFHQMNPSSSGIKTSFLSMKEDEIKKLLKNVDPKLLPKDVRDKLDEKNRDTKNSRQSFSSSKEFVEPSAVKKSLKTKRPVYGSPYLKKSFSSDDIEIELGMSKQTDETRKRCLNNTTYSKTFKESKSKIKPNLTRPVYGSPYLKKSFSSDEIAFELELSKQVDKMRKGCLNNTTYSKTIEENKPKIKSNHSEVTVDYIGNTAIMNPKSSGIDCDKHLSKHATLKWKNQKTLLNAKSSDVHQKNFKQKLLESEALRKIKHQRKKQMKNCKNELPKELKERLASEILCHAAFSKSQRNPSCFNFPKKHSEHNSEYLSHDRNIIESNSEFSSFKPKTFQKCKSSTSSNRQNDNTVSNNNAQLSHRFSESDVKHITHKLVEPSKISHLQKLHKSDRLKEPYNRKCSEKYRKSVLPSDTQPFIAQIAAGHSLETCTPKHISIKKSQDAAVQNKKKLSDNCSVEQKSCQGDIHVHSMGFNQSSSGLLAGVAPVLQKQDNSVNSNVCTLVRESTVKLVQERLSSVLDGDKETGDIEMLDVSADLQKLDQFNESQKSCSDPRSYCFVVDTNIFMHALNLIEELKDIPIHGAGSLHIVVPWVVLQELDGIKNRKDQNMHLAVEAVKYINNMLKSKHPRFHGQTAKMSALARKEYDHCNDDVILACCLQLAENIPQEKIILLSNDINLCNKAMVTGISTHTALTLKAVIVSETQAAQKAVFVPQKCLDAAVSMKGDESPNVSDSKKTVDYIICEVKLLLKFCLEPFLREAMAEAFGDLSIRFLPSSPATLYDILNCYQRYWVSVFGLKFNLDTFAALENLAKIFNTSTGTNFENITHTLLTLENAQRMCTAVSQFKPCITPIMQHLSVLIQQCQNLVNEEENSKNPGQTIAEEHQENNRIVLAVYNHIWALISHLCGLTLSYIGIPHDFEYNKPDKLPCKLEFQLLLCNLYPNIHKLKKTMMKILEGKLSEDKFEKEIRNLYNYLLHFVPSLEIQALPPPTDDFTVWRLKKFFLDPENSEMLENGLRQLNLFSSKLEECVHHPIWK